MIRIVHAARVDAGNGRDLDMEILLNQVGGIFKPDEEAASNEDSLQAALSANVQRSNFANRGMAAQDRKGQVPKKNPDNRSPKQFSSEILKLIQAVFDMKAEIGCMRKALGNAGITIEKSPNGQKPREQIAHGKQKNKFAGAAKKNKANKLAQKSLVPVANQYSDCDDDNQPEYGNMVIVAKPKHLSPRLINAMMVGITRSNPDHRRIS